MNFQSNRDVVVARFVAINCVQQIEDDRHAVDDVTMVTMVGDHWVRWCTETELRAILQGGYTEVDYERLAQKYCDATLTEASG